MIEFHSIFHWEILVEQKVLNLRNMRFIFSFIPICEKKLYSFTKLINCKEVKAEAMQLLSSEMCQGFLSHCYFALWLTHIWWEKENLITEVYWISEFILKVESLIYILNRSQIEVGLLPMYLLELVNIRLIYEYEINIWWYNSVYKAISFNKKIWY